MSRSAVTVVLLVLALAQGALSCGPGRGAGRGRGPRKLTPLVFKQHVPNVPENSVIASGLSSDKPITRNDTRFKDLVPNYNQDIHIKDEEGTGADRLMTQRCAEKLNTLAISVMNQWPGVWLLVTEGWDEDGKHSPNSLHYEGRAVDITTTDRDRSKYGMLARLAVEAGFDWVYYESRSHIHCSVKSESSSASKYGGCFSGDTTVQTETGVRRKLSDLQVGEKILAKDPSTTELIFSEVILFLDYDPTDNREFQHVTLKSGRTLTVTATHLVLVGSVSRSRTVFAGELSLGDTLLVSDRGGLVEDEVVGLKAVLKQGVYAPLTAAGNLVVNDVVASCYASIDSQRIAHWAFSPLRLYVNMKHGMSRLWSIVSKPMTHHHEVVAAKVPPSIGVNWYAKALYAVANVVIPSHLH